MKKIYRMKELIWVAFLLLLTGCAVYAPAPYYNGGPYYIIMDTHLTDFTAEKLPILWL
jgi:hypothetical protein